jgi:hypothetical protein
MKKSLKPFPDDELPWLLHRKDVLRLCGLDKRALRRLVAAGALHTVPIGCRELYYTSEVIRLCKAE